MQLQSIKVIYLKEMLDLMRDRRTIISMIVFPLVFVPLLFMGMNYFLFKSIDRARSKQFALALKQEPGLEGLSGTLEQAGFIVRPADDPRRAVENKETDLGVDVSGEANSPAVRIFVDQSELGTMVAVGRIETALNLLKEARIKNDLQRAGVNERILSPFTVEKVNTAPPQKMSGMLVGGIIGLIFVTFMLMGAMYPAIDMTAGEKERRTMEMLLSSPAGRVEIVLAKILATITACVLTGLLAIASLGISFYGGIRGARDGVQPAVEMKISLDATTFVLMIILMIPMAVMCATLVIAIATRAKSFKEASSYLSPLILVALIPSFMSMVPGIKLNAVMALIPIFNFSQLIKELMLGEWTWQVYIVTLVSTIIYAAIAFTSALMVFKNERILFRT
ncbi:MAG: ABC transporter permease subunit [Acidobacteria bacterium]|nr:ABC transporter permease subunit [Acidobacteriota bacterium]